MEKITIILLAGALTSALAFAPVSLNTAGGGDEYVRKVENGRYKKPQMRKGTKANVKSVPYGTGNIGKTPKLSRWETGIDFIRSEHGIKIDSDFFLDPEVLRGNHSFLNFVQAFVKNVKGLKYAKTKDSDDYPKDGKKKVAWSFLPYHLARLAKVEFGMYKVLRMFTFEERYRSSRSIPVLESYLSEIEASSLKAIMTITDSNLNKPEGEQEGPYFYVATHPILIYQMIRRFSEDVPDIMSLLGNDKKLISKLNKLKKEFELESFLFPSSDDLDESLNSILRIQTGNDINTVDFANGIFEDVQTNIKVNALQALEIGAFFTELEVVETGLEWFSYAKQTLEKSPLLIQYPEIKKFFVKCIQYADKMLLDKLEDDNGHGQCAVPDFKLLRTQIMAVPKLTKEMLDVFFPLCGGKNFQTEYEKSRLKCWHEFRLNPYWKLQPLKIELLNEFPPIVQIHDFIGNYLASVLRVSTVEELERSKVYSKEKDDEESKGGRHERTRTSYQSWVDERIPISCKFAELYKEPLENFSKRLELILGLRIAPFNSSEPYQVAVYGSSQHFAPHLDIPLEPNQMVDHRGKRQTTIMGYLNDVKVGGRTAFPLFGFSVKPVKGSIVMWNNLQNDAIHTDERVWHGGCPVSLGVKWIVNKWVKHYDNAFNQKCGLSSPKVFLSKLEAQSNLDLAKNGFTQAINHFSSENFFKMLESA